VQPWFVRSTSGPAWAQFPWARVGLYERAYRVRLDLVIALQSAISAGFSWYIAADVLHHIRPIFAPISAVIVLVGTAGRRLRRAFEMVIGVALGIAVGDLLIYLIGVGPWQIGVVVALAIIVTVFLNIGAVAVGQAASTAILVATLAPPSGGIYYTRFVDSFVGGAVGIVVMALLLPFNPLTRVRRAAAATLGALSDALVQVAEAFEQADADRAEAALDALRANENEHQNLRDSLTAAQETATLAPIRWRSRPALHLYLDSAVHIERATRNVRVLARRAAVSLRDGESVPPRLCEGLRRLADAVATLSRELADGRVPIRTRQLILEAVALVSEAYRVGVGFSGAVVVAQVRSAAVDLLLATGLPDNEAARAVRAVRDQATSN
jgi:uncharacterized membrane protein YgaE (UPF0421/DUF939 family)